MARLTESDLGLVLVLWKNRSTRVADFVPALLADIAAANREIEELRQQLKKPQPDTKGGEA